MDAELIKIIKTKNSWYSKLNKDKTNEQIKIEFKYWENKYKKLVDKKT